MPFVRIGIQSGKTGQYKRALLHAVRRALAASLGVPEERIMQRIDEYEPENLDVPESKSDRLTMIDIAMLPRDGALKRDLFREITRTLAFSPGISASDVMIVVNEPHRECFGICGEVPEEAPPATERPAEARDHAGANGSRLESPDAPEGSGPADAVVGGGGLGVDE